MPVKGEILEAVLMARKLLFVSQEQYKTVRLFLVGFSVRAAQGSLLTMRPGLFRSFAQH